MAGLRLNDDGLPIRPIINVIDNAYFTDDFVVRRFPRDEMTHVGPVRFRSIAHYVSSHDPYCRNVIFGSPDDRWLPTFEGKSVPRGFQVVEGCFL